MIGIFRRSEEIDIFCTELYEVSTSGYVTLKIWHFNGTSIIEDLAETTMTKHEDGRWYYRYHIPSSAQYGIYHVIFSKYDTEGAAVTTGDYQVWDGSVSTAGSGIGLVTDTVTNSLGAPIAGVQVSAYVYGDLTKKIAETITSVAGIFELYLDPGTYIIRFTKDGWVSKTITEVVS